MKKLFPPTLSWYLVKQYTFNFCALLFSLLAVIYIFDVVELLRRAAKMDHVPVTLVLQMGVYKLPEVGQLAFPFAVLFSAMLTFWQLTRRHELVIVRASGLSVWQFIMPVMVTALLIGVLNTALINPLGSLFVGKFESLEAKHLERQGALVSFSEQGLWLRQDHEGGTAILHAPNIEMPGWILNRAVVLFFSQDNDFLRRIDSTSSKLETGQWSFTDAVVSVPSKQSENVDFLTLATDLTVRDLEGSFSSPETISFWKLRNYINTLEKTGFNTISLKIHFQKLLSQPLFYMAMILLAASVSLRSNRMSGGAIMAIMGVFIGFFVFFASSFLQALGASQQIPIFVAAWFPAIISFLLGIGVLLTIEDG